MPIDADVRRGFALTHGKDEALDVEALVVTHCDPLLPRSMTVDQIEGDLSFGSAARPHKTRLPSPFPSKNRQLMAMRIEDSSRRG
jgi:hypothetical protein